MTSAKAYQDGLAELRGVRDEMKPLERQLTKIQADLGKLRAQRDEKIRALGAYEKAKADRLATSAGCLSDRRRHPGALAGPPGPRQHA